MQSIQVLRIYTYKKYIKYRDLIWLHLLMEIKPSKIANFIILTPLSQSYGLGLTLGLQMSAIIFHSQPFGSFRACPNYDHTHTHTFPPTGGRVAISSTIDDQLGLTRTSSC